MQGCAQEWLWCETWCGNATKAAAKTIDLCNNPLTKEPKLEGARRIVAEWPALDAEQARFTQQVRSFGSTIRHQARTSAVHTALRNLLLRWRAPSPSWLSGRSWMLSWLLSRSRWDTLCRCPRCQTTTTFACGS